MVSWVGGEITDVPLKEILNKLKLVDVEKYYDTERYNGRRTIL
jgi:6-phosphofructokinase 1